jgi:hypothetical protein
MKKAFLSYLLISFILTAFNNVTIDKTAFYESLSSGEEAVIDKTLAILESEKSSSQVKAYIGVLTMKKAGFVKGVKSKLNTFKKGEGMLEEEIKNNPSNVEYRFLRLTIQEHAPGILKYNKQLDEDKQAVTTAYSKLDKTVKTFVADYAKGSKVLKSSDLK